MKTPKEFIDERLTIQNGHLKGARVTISEQICEELMEEYHKQFKLTDEEIRASIPYSEPVSSGQIAKNVGWVRALKWIRDLIFKK